MTLRGFPLPLTNCTAVEFLSVPTSLFRHRNNFSTILFRDLSIHLCRRRFFAVTIILLSRNVPVSGLSSVLLVYRTRTTLLYALVRSKSASIVNGERYGTVGSILALTLVILPHS